MPPQRTAHHRRQPLDTQRIHEAHLSIDHIANGNRREIGPVGLI